MMSWVRALACISHHLTVEAPDKADMTSLRLVAVLNVRSSTPPRAKRLSSFERHARLPAPDRTSIASCLRSVRPASSPHCLLCRQCGLSLGLSGNPDYGVMSDDWSFVVTESMAADTRRFIRVVQNWHEEFHDRQQD